MRARPGRLIVSGDDARAALMRGLDLVADAVGPTLGPCGSHVLLQRHDAGPLVTNDGVTIARAIETLRDPYTNQGVQLLREVAGVTDTVVGDGTTTAVITARELLRRSLAAVTRGADCASLCQGLTRGWATASQLIDDAAAPLRDAEELTALAAGAARDEKIGGLVAAALQRTGHDGVVNVEDHRAYGVRLDFADGMSFPSGLLAPGLATDDTRRETVFERPLILLASERITQINQLAPVLRQAAAQRTPLVVIADEVSGDALTMLVLNVRKRTVPAVAVKAPLFGEDRVAMLQDIAALTGATLCGPVTGTSVANATIADLGRAERVMVTHERTTITSGHGEKRAIIARLAGIDAELAYLGSEYERDKRCLRRACLGVRWPRSASAWTPWSSRRRHGCGSSTRSARGGRRCAAASFPAAGPCSRARPARSGATPARARRGSGSGSWPRRSRRLCVSSPRMPGSIRPSPSTGLGALRPVSGLTCTVMRSSTSGPGG